MHFELSTLLTAVLMAVPALSAPTKNECKNPIVRKEWRQLSIPERSHFLNAVSCLHQIPATRNNQFPGTTSDFEAFAVQHKLQTPWVHYTGLFLPWHRLFLREYERSLQEKCGYTGALPYWDYTIDSGPGKNFTTDSPIWHPEHGFGGNGAFDQATHDAFKPVGDFYGGGCVTDGPFKNWKLHVPKGRFFNGTVSEATPVCLKRNFWLDYTEWTTQDKEDAVMEQKTFEAMEYMLEGGSVPGQWAGLHTGGHFIMAGMGETTGGDVWTANLEPVFYLHHANIDRVWYEWQNQNKREHLWSIGLRTTPREPEVYGKDEDFGFSDATDEPVTADTPFDMGAFGGARNYVKVGQVLDTKGGTSPEGHKGVLCYKYSKSPKPKKQK